MHKYGMIIHWSDDDQAFIAEAPELPGCTAHGDSPVAAASNCTDAIGHWIDVARARGRPVPAPKAGRPHLA